MIINNKRRYQGKLADFLFLMVFSCITSGYAFSQRIEVINSGFEELDSISGKFVKGWLPGTDESEVFIPAGTDFASLSEKESEPNMSLLIADSFPHTGRYCLSLAQGRSVVQTLSHQIFQGKHYTLTFYARSKNLSAKLNTKLYFLGGYGREKLTASDFELTPQYQLFTLKYRAIVPESYGYKIGIMFGNVSQIDISVLIDDVSMAGSNE